MNILELSIKELLNSKPFYANFFLNSKIIYDQPNVPTAAAGLTSDGIVMIFNRSFINSLKTAEVCAVIEHEVLHILFEHLAEMKNEKLSQQLANIAMDVAINQYITSLPPGCLTLAEVNKAAALNMLPNETWEYYYSQLLTSKKIPQSMKPHDSHGEIDSKEASTDLGKAILKQAIESAAKAAAGNLPEEILTIIDKLRNTSQVSWKQILRNFVASSVSNSTINTRKRVNRRFGLDQPGKKKKRELVLGVCVDSSGSVSEDSYDKFMAEILSMSKIASKIYIVEADCIVQNVEEVGKGKKLRMTRKGCGGTAYQPAITECMKLGCDAIIYFGDFDSSDKPQNPGRPFLWVGVGTSPKPGDFGAEVRLK